MAGTSSEEVKLFKTGIVRADGSLTFKKDLLAGMEEGYNFVYTKNCLAFTSGTQNDYCLIIIPEGKPSTGDSLISNAQQKCATLKDIPLKTAGDNGNGGLKISQNTYPPGTPVSFKVNALNHEIIVEKINIKH